MKDRISDKIYIGQFAILAFISSVCFKIVMLPQYLAATAGRNAWLAMLTLVLVDGAALACVYAVVRRTDLPSLPAPVPVKKIMLAVIGLTCFMKLVLFTSETTAYCSTTLFDEGLWRLILAGLIPTLVYLTVKGGNVLARTAQIIVWFVAAVVVLNIFFAESAGTLKNVLPVKYDAKVIFACDKYLAWFGDFSPLLFFTVSGKKRKNPVKLVTIIFLPLPISSNVSNLFIFKSGEMAIATEVKKSSIGNKHTSFV